MVSKLLILSALFSLAAAKPMARNMKLHESREHPPSGFVRSGAADASKVLELRIALVQNNPDGLIDTLYAVSTPDSPSYGKHLSKDEVEKFVAPATATSKAVYAWLKEAGLTATTLSPAGDWLAVSMPVGKANELFDADFAVYTHSDTGKQFIRTMSYSIPTELSSHLDFVHPTISFSNPHGTRPIISTTLTGGVEKRTIDPLAVCSPTGVAPACVQSVYNISSTPATSKSNNLAVSGFLGQYANQADLTTFLKEFRSDLNSSTAFALQTLDGGSNPQSGSQAGTEANLDIQYTVGIASGVPVTFISVGSATQDGLSGFLDLINFLLNESSPPQVLTTSYGQNEDTVSPSLANNLCNAYAQLGARGTSILFASGDGGVGGSQSNPICISFVPTFPSGCPFITSVGATQLTSSGGETAASFSSGGFSNYFNIPPYQSAAVSSYKSKLGNTDKGRYNASGRGYPDVAAVGKNVEIVVDGDTETVDGTSCASPIFASVIALINDGLLNANKPPLGFLNPFLYANPSAFNDVTAGSNTGCLLGGFPTATGWDPVTGLGTPNFAKLKAAAGV